MASREVFFCGLAAVFGALAILSKRLSKFGNSGLFAMAWAEQRSRGMQRATTDFARAAETRDNREHFIAFVLGEDGEDDYLLDKESEKLNLKARRVEQAK